MADKTCTKCGVAKSLSEYHRASARADGVQAYCKECGNRQAAQWRERNRERYLETLRAYAEKHRDRRLAESREYRAQHLYERRKQFRAWYWKDPESQRERARKWTAENPQRRADAEARRRARRLGSPAIEKIDRRAIFDRDGGRCHICLKQVPASDFTLDHLTPLARDGEHTAKNLRVAHRSCNSSRGVDRIPAQLLLIG